MPTETLDDYYNNWKWNRPEQITSMTDKDRLFIKIHPNRKCQYCHHCHNCGMNERECDGDFKPFKLTIFQKIKKHLTKH